MKPFTKKQNIIFLILSFVFFLLTFIPVIYSNNLLQILHPFLENKVFHRTFELGKWTDTINALIAFPIFFVILIDTIIFLRFSNKSKTILLIFYGICFLIFTGIIISMTSYNYIDSDEVSELLLAKECYLQKYFWPTQWHYSTELRTLNAQIISAPLFLFTSNLHLIKIITAEILIFLMALSLFFFLSELKIQELWMKLLACLWIIVPFSWVLYRFLHFGNYYIPHVSIIFCFLGLFYGLIFNDYSKKKKTVYLILFCLLSFIAGVSGIRYILYFEIPLAILYFWRQTYNLFEEKQKFNFKQFFFGNIKIKTTFISLIFAIFGYFLNSFVLNKFYSYSNWNTARFNPYGDITFTRFFGELLTVFGYQHNVSVFTPGGVVNVLLFVFIVFFIICFIKAYKTETSEKNKDFLSFLLIMTVFNCFIFKNTDQFYNRFLILPFIFVLPCIILFIKNPAIKTLYKGIITFSFTIIVLTSTVLVYESFLNEKRNDDKIGITNFLKNNDYHYGYASFWNANVFTYLTDGKIEVANLDRDEADFYNFHIHKWLTPERYCTDDFGGNEKMILIVTKDEYTKSSDAKLFSNGKLVFRDDYYYIFEYKDNKTFKESF